MALDPIDKSILMLVQVMAWCRQVTSHYYSQCSPRSMLQYGINKPQWMINQKRKNSYNLLVNWLIFSCNSYDVGIWELVKKLMESCYVITKLQICIQHYDPGIWKKNKFLKVLTGIPPGEGNKPYLSRDTRVHGATKLISFVGWFSPHLKSENLYLFLNISFIFGRCHCSISHHSPGHHQPWHWHFDSARSTGLCPSWKRISIICLILILRNNVKNNYFYVSSKQMNTSIGR